MSGGKVATLQDFFKSTSLYTAATLLLAGAGAYYGLSGRVEKLEIAIARQNERDAKQDDEIKTVATKADAKLEAIARDLNDIKVSAKETNTNVQWLLRYLKTGGLDKGQP